MMPRAHAPRCPLCPGHGMHLGTLGAMRWYRCRDCGGDFGRRRRITAAHSMPANQPGGQDELKRDRKPA
jgi:tRNA(Ile2) C34 agmatinyltransferase TiaS